MLRESLKETKKEMKSELVDAKREILACENQRRVEMCLDTETQEKLNNSTTILDEILRNQGPWKIKQVLVMKEQVTKSST